MRLFGLLFIALGAFAIVRDVIAAQDAAAAGAEGAGFAFATLGELWAELHRPSLIGLQSGLENRVSPTIFFDYVLPVLEQPAGPLLIGVGAALFALGAWLAIRRANARAKRI